MSFETIERASTRDRLMGVQQAVLDHPSNKSYILDEVTVMDIINMSEVADFNVVLQFVPKTLLHPWSDN